MNIENNKIIAQFMGYKLTPCNNGMTWEYTLSNRSSDDILNIHGRLLEKNSNYFKWDSDWNWLMLVLRKCLEGEAEHNAKIAKETIKSMYEYLCDQDIRGVYNYCVEFIKWYNEQKKV